MNNTDISQLKNWKEWRTEKGSHIFKSDESMRWFFRVYGKELVAAKALVKLQGSWFVTPDFGTVAFDVLASRGSSLVTH